MNPESLLQQVEVIEWNRLTISISHLNDIGGMNIAHEWQNDGLAECEPEKGGVLNSIKVDKVLHLVDHLQDLEGPFLPVGHWVL